MAKSSIRAKSFFLIVGRDIFIHTKISKEIIQKNDKASIISKSFLLIVGGELAMDRAIENSREYLVVLIINYPTIFEYLPFKLVRWLHWKFYQLGDRKLGDLTIFFHGKTFFLLLINLLPMVKHS